MKSVLISIKPKWCELIASGEKTIEVRKTKPKLETPFKVYIYCTRQKVNGEILLTCDKRVVGRNRGFRDNGDIPLAGKVIGEFVCDNIDWHGLTNLVIKEDAEHTLEGTCLTADEVLDYLNYERGTNIYASKNFDFYSWHISNLVIYDKPKELSEFYVWKKCNSCRDTGYESAACCYDVDCKVPATITRPPQSWYYVEELDYA